MSPIAPKALRYFETVRHLRTGQVTNRIVRKFRGVSIDTSSAPPLRKPAEVFNAPIDRGVRLSGPDSLTLINQEGRVGNAAAWNDPARPKLWLYNLHYFDWLVGERDELHRDWERGLLTRWITENPVGQGNGWEPYPLSLRIGNWVKWLLAGNHPPPGMLDSLAIQLRALTGQIEWHLLGNHLLANAKALFLGGALFDSEEANRWLTVGDRLLSDQWQAQVLADGGHEERSPMYQAILLEDVLDCLTVARAFGLTGSRVAHRAPTVAASMLGWLEVMTHPSGMMGQFNDTAPGIAPTLKQLATYSELCGVQAVRPAAHGGVTFLEESGYLRAEVDGAVLIADCAPVGPDHQPGHAHADTLGFEFSVGGNLAFVSGGTSTYEIGVQRAWERSTAAHNCVVLDGVDSSDVWAGFRVGRRAYVDPPSVTRDGRAIVISASHNGYRHLRGSPMVKRQWRLAEGELQINDAVASARHHESAAWLHLPVGSRADIDGPLAVAQLEDGTRLGISASASLGSLHTTRSLGFNRTKLAPSLTYALIEGVGRCTIRWEIARDTVHNGN